MRLHSAVANTEANKRSIPLPGRSKTLAATSFPDLCCTGERAQGLASAKCEYHFFVMCASDDACEADEHSIFQTLQSIPFRPPQHLGRGSFTEIPSHTRPSSCTYLESQSCSSSRLQSALAIMYALHARQAFKHTRPHRQYILRPITQVEM